MESQDVLPDAPILIKTIDERTWKYFENIFFDNSMIEMVVKNDGIWKFKLVSYPILASAYRLVYKNDILVHSEKVRVIPRA